MAAQNIIELGIDVTAFSEDKKKLLNEFIVLFDKLEKYDGLKVNPVMGEGLTNFNKSISETTKLLDELNVKMAQLNGANNGAAQSTNNLTNSTNQSNTSKQNSKNATDAAAKSHENLSNQLKAQTKDNAALRVELSEMRKALLDEAKANNESYKSRIASIEAAKQAKIAAKEESDAKKEAIRQQKADQKEINALEKESTRQKKIQDKEASDAYKRQVKEEAAEAKKSAREKINADRERTREAQKNAKIVEAALKEEERLNNSLIDKHAQLKAVTKDRQSAYVNNFVEFGGDDARTKKSLREAQESAALLDGLNIDMRTAEGNASRLGKSLSGALSQLRVLAYILPGIGLAGIFNLIFEGIGKAISAMGIFGVSLEKQLTVNTELNGIFKDQIGLLGQLIEKVKELNALNRNSIENQTTRTGIDAARGFSPDKIIKQETETAKDKYGRNLVKLKETFGTDDDDSVFKSLDNRLQGINLAAAKLQQAKGELADRIKLDAGLYKIENGKIVDRETGKRINTSPFLFKSTLDANVAFRQSEYTKELEKYNLIKGVADDYYTSLNEMRTKDADSAKFFDDQARKRRIDIANENNSLIADQAEKQLSADRSSQKSKEAALATILSTKRTENRLAYDDVIQNNTSTPAERDIATNKLRVSNLKAQLDYNDKLVRLRDEYNQRYIKAVEAIQKDEINKEAIQNERIFKNDERGYDERILAYSKYVTLRQKEEDIEFAREEQQLQLKAKKDPTVQKELDALRANRESQKAVKQADVEKQVFEIVSSSLGKQLKAVMDANDIQAKENIVLYTKELKDLNDSYERKEVTLEKYLKRRKALENKYNVKELDEQILDDERDITGLKQNAEKLNKRKEDNQVELGAARSVLDYVTTSGDGDKMSAQKRVDAAIGEEKAINQAIIDNKKELGREEDELNKDRLKKEQIRIQGILDAEKDKLDKLKKYAKIAEDIEKALYKAIKQVSDAEYENRIGANEERRRINEEGYEREIAAIEKSSLTAKDKAALDVQLNTQKEESNRAAAAEEKRLKREQAEFDKKLAIAHIIFGTAAAVVGALPDIPRAIAVGAIGAIELVAAIATPIPAYEEGTGGIPHQGGLARTGEGGKPEIIKEPYKSPYIVWKDNISYLPKGTEVIPIRNSPEFNTTVTDDGWEQTRYLAKQMKKNNREIKNVFKPTINVDLGHENYKRRILGN